MSIETKLTELLDELRAIRGMLDRGPTQVNIPADTKLSFVKTHFQDLIAGNFTVLPPIIGSNFIDVADK